MNKPFYNNIITEEEIAEIQRYVEVLVKVKHDVKLLTQRAIADGKVSHMKSLDEFLNGTFIIDGVGGVLLLNTSKNEDLYIREEEEGKWAVIFISNGVEVKLYLNKLPNLTTEELKDFTRIFNAQADFVLSSVRDLDEIAKLRNKIVLSISTSIKNKLDELGIKHERVDFNLFCSHLLTPTAILPNGKTIIFECTQDGKSIVSLGYEQEITMPLVLPYHECLNKGILSYTLGTIVNMSKLLPGTTTPLQTRQYIEDVIEQANLTDEVNVLEYV